MADTFTLTPNKSLKKPDRGSFVDTWDGPVNDDWDYIDNALGGTYTVSATSGNITLSTADARYQQIKLPNSSAGSPRSLIFPLKPGSSTVAVGGMWVVDNSSNNQDLYVTTLAPGTNQITIKANKRQIVFSNGTGVFFADDTRLTAGNGITITDQTVALTQPVTPDNGGTGLTGTYQAGQLLIGKADGTLAKAFLTAGTNVTITNSDGGITIASTGGGTGTGGLTSISLNSSLAGITFDPATITTTATSTTIKGILGIANGGTGVDKYPANPGLIKLSGTTFTSIQAVDINAETINTLNVNRGGTGKSTWDLGAVWANGSLSLTSGVLPEAYGGTGFTAFGSGVSAALQLATSGTGGLARTASPTFSGTANFSSISSTSGQFNITAPAGNYAISARVSTNSDYTYVGRRADQTATFLVDGAGNAILSGTVTPNGIQVGPYQYSGAVSRFTTSTANWAIEVSGNTADLAFFRVNAAGIDFQRFYYGTSLLGTIYNTGTGVTYNTASDYRLKENVETYTSGLNAIKELRPVTFSWKSDAEHKRVSGFIAHEVQAIIPDAVTGEKDALDKDGNMKVQVMDKSNIIPALVSAVKELSARVEALEAKIAQM